MKKDNDEENKDKKFLILDGHSLAYRAFFALPLELKTKNGLHTGAVLGFTNMLVRLLKEQFPAYIAACFDYPAPTFRHQKFEEYKATREKTPEEMSEQLPLIKEMLSSFNIPFFEMEGYEADDLIGSFSSRAEEGGLDTVIVTADSDFYQLLSPVVHVLVTKKGITELELFTEEKLEEKYGLTPEQWIDFKALKGDSSDNVPGIPGIGEKRALQLLEKFNSLEALLRCTEQIGGKLGETIFYYSNNAILSKELVTIKKDLPLDHSIEECRFTGPDWQSLYNICQRLEFKNIINKFAELPGFQEKNRKSVFDNGQLSLDKEGAWDRDEHGLEYEKNTVLGNVNDANYVDISNINYIDDAKKVEHFFSILDETDQSSILLFFPSPSTEEMEPTGLIFVTDKEEKYYLPFNEGTHHKKRIGEILSSILITPQLTLITHDVKALLKYFARSSGVKSMEEINCTFFDSLLASYLINPERDNYMLFLLMEEYMNISFDGEYLREANGFDEQLSLYFNAAVKLLNLKETLLHLLKERELEELYYDIELPLAQVLVKMETRGIKISKDVLNKLEHEMNESMEALQKEIFQLAGLEFNLNSPKQLSHVLFEKLNLPVIRKIKTGYSTDAKVLQELSAYHPIAAKIVKYRTVAKLKNTYIDGLRPLVNPETGKIYTTFNQAVTATGRLSSSHPNLQNIPIRLEEGRRLREAFGPSSSDKLLLAADYSQIELRILAHLSRDQNLLDAFAKEQDIHTRTAAEVFGVSLEQVTSTMRSRAKAVNFGIIYGMSDYGLSQDLGITRTEAREYIDSYFQRYTGVREYVEKCVSEAKEKGYVTTVLNRRRYLPDINHKNFTRRSFAERMARNTPIQGSAADIIKAAMVALEKRLEKDGLELSMLLQVHDELIFELPENELEEAGAVIKELMESIFPLEVPLIVELKKGENWYHMIPLQGV